MLKNKKSILIIHDDKFLTDIIVKDLSDNKSLTIKIVSDGEKGLVAIEKNPPEIIIADWQGSIIDGLQLCKILKSEEYERFKKIPIIIISATNDLTMKNILLEEGAYSFLSIQNQETGELVKLINDLLSEDNVQASNSATPEMKGNILIIDDDVSIVRLLNWNFSQRGYLVNTAYDGEEAIRKVKLFRPQIIFLDYYMPKMNGKSVLKWITNNNPNSRTILMTAYGSEDIAVEFMKIGAKDYIKKPFSIPEIIEICNKNFELYNANLLNEQFKKIKIQQEYEQTKVETLSQTLTTLSHYINNAVQVLTGKAFICEKENPESVENLLNACTQCKEKIGAVLESLDDMVQNMQMRTVNYLNEEQKMLDIEETLKRRLNEIEQKKV